MRWWAAACAALSLLPGCAKPALPPAVAIEISHVVGAQPFALGETFKTAAGDPFTATRLRYYLSGFRLRRADGSWFEAPRDEQSDAGYYLVDEAVPASKTFKLPPAPAGEYQGVEFRLGIDPARNHGGAQTGVLDPARGMFWMWNTGYIFLKLEGQSPASPEDEHRVTLHIGGGDALARTIYLALDAKPIRVAAGVQPTIHLAADVAAFFAGEPPLRLAETHSVMSAPEGAPLADRAARLFRLEHVHNEPVGEAR